MPVSPTPAQAEASRLNGARSRGPVTPEGKARSALNGTRHGLRGSTFTLLPDEDPAAWAALLAGYLARLRPADEAELACVERLAACDWREARLLRLEAEMLFAGPTTRPNPTRASAGRARCPATPPRSGATARRRWSSSTCCAPRARACPPSRHWPTRPGCAGWPSGPSARRRKGPRPSTHARTRAGPGDRRRASCHARTRARPDAEPRAAPPARRHRPAGATGGRCCRGSGPATLGRRRDGTRAKCARRARLESRRPCCLL